MAKQTEFEHPPRGHGGLLVYDSVSDSWYAVLGDANGHLKVDVVTSGLPTGGATAANQTTMITALELIDDLRNALDSVGTDELDVNIEDSITLTVQAPGGDKIWSFESGVWDAAADTNLAAGVNNLDSTAAPTGKVWVITNIAVMYFGTSPTRIVTYLRHAGSNYALFGTESPNSLEWYDKQGWWVLEAGDVIRAQVTGATLNDDLYLRLNGFVLDAP